MTPCPPLADLGRLLAGHLPAAAEPAVLAHIDGCSACQAALERATAGAAGPPPDPPPTERFLRVLAARPPDLRATPVVPGPPPSLDARTVMSALPGFEPVGELGRGGMGVVYKAWQTGLKRFVAVKLLDGHRADNAEAVVRFRIEAETLASLQHPNIVQVYEVGEVGGRAFFAMEYVDGGTLAGAWAGRPQAPAAAAGLVEAVARAVQYAHLRGVLHRDLKPANVLLTRRPRHPPADDRLRATDYGVPKISDFGLAKRLALDHAVTATGVVVGTPEYMAPEQTAGAGDHGPGCDVYALGVLLYEGLTGRPPFKGGNVFDLLDQVRTRPPPRPRNLAPRVPADLETVCLKCLEKEPGRRYPSAADLADDLGRFRRGEPVLARRAGPAERAWKWTRRNPAGAALGAVSLAAVLAAGGFVGGRASNARLSLALAAADDARYRHLIALAAADWAARDPRQALRQLDDCPPARRGWEWHHLRRACRPHLVELAGLTARPPAVGFDPAGGRVLAVGPDGAVRAWDAATGLPLPAGWGWDGPAAAAAFDPARDRAVFGDAAGRVGVRAADGTGGWAADRPLPGVTAAAFGPDGRTVATAHADDVVRVWDAGTGAAVGEFPVHLARGLGYSPDGRQVVAAGSGNSVARWDVAGRAPLEPLVGRDAAGRPAREFSSTAVAVSPDGRLVAATCADQAVRVWDAATGEQVRLLATADEPAGLGFSPDGGRLAVGGFDRTARVWDAADWDAPPVLAAVDGPLVEVGFAPGGRRLLTAGPDGTLKVWRAGPLAAAGVRPAAGGPANSVAHAPGGRLVVGNGKGVVSVLDAAGDGPAAELGRRASAVWAVAVRPGGRQAAAIWRDGTLQVWDLPAGTPAGPEVTAHADKGANGLQAGRTVGYSPDGRLLATGGLDGAVKVWDADSRELLATLPADPAGVECLRFSPAGELLAVGGRSERVALWDTADWSPAGTLPPHGGAIRCLAFGPGGRTLAVGGQAPAVRVWDLARGQPAAELPGYTGVVFALAFHPSGRLASAGRDGVISLWDPAAGVRLLTLAGHANEVYGLAFDGAGRRLASASRDGTVRVWDGGDE